MIQQRDSERCIFEQSMNHCADDVAAARDRAVRMFCAHAATGSDRESRLRCVAALDNSHMNLVTTDLRRFAIQKPRRTRTSDHARRDLLRFESGSQRQQPETVRDYLARFDAMRIFDNFAEHLASTAYSEHQTSTTNARDDFIRESLTAHPRQIGDRALGPGNNHQIGAREVFNTIDEPNLHSAFVFQREEIIVVGKRGELPHGDINLRGRKRAREARLQRHRILVSDSKLLDPRNYAQYRNFKSIAKKIESGLQQSDFAAKFVD